MSECVLHRLVVLNFFDMIQVRIFEVKVYRNCRSLQLARDLTAFDQNILFSPQ